MLSIFCATATTNHKSDLQLVSRLACPCETSGRGVVMETKLKMLVQKLADIKNKVGVLLVGDWSLCFIG